MNKTSRFPVADAASMSAKVWGTIAALVAALAGVGVISVDQNTTLQAVIVGAGALVSAVSTALAAFKVRNVAEPLVTPLVEPRDDRGNQLIPLQPESR
jgi:hypothetical protein